MSGKITGKSMGVHKKSAGDGAYAYSMEEIRKMKAELRGKRWEEVKEECEKRGFAYEMSGSQIFIATSRGKWRFDAAKKKIHLFHKNYRFRQSTSGNYHRQFIREWTVKDLVAYIARHDGNGQEGR